MGRRGRPLSVNKIIEDNGDWLLIDISVPSMPNCSMAVDSDVWNKYSGGKVYAKKSSARKYLYACHSVRRLQKLFHRYILDAGELQVDHKEHGTLNFIDNRLSNLRVATSSQNNMNHSIRKNNTSGFTGVHYEKSRSQWKVSISIDGVETNIGRFKDMYVAIDARKQAEREHYREFAFNN